MTDIIDGGAVSASASSSSSSTFMQKDSLRLIYAPPSKEKEQLAAELGGKTGLDALIYLLGRKHSRQHDLLDSKFFTIVAGTGAGKSTTMVYGLYKNLILSRYGKKSLLCTQPRINLAIMQPYNLEHLFRDVHVGEELGYLTGSAGGKVYPKKDKSIIYCTTRILENSIKTLGAEKFGQRYPVVVIDEAHDQSIEMLMTLFTVKQYLADHHAKPYCPLFVVTSATIDPLLFIRYFGANAESPYNSAFIAGKSEHPLDERYLSTEVIQAAEEDAVKLAVGEVMKELAVITAASSSSSSPSDGPPLPRAQTDILVFWTSATEILRFFKALDAAITIEKTLSIGTIHIASTLGPAATTTTTASSASTGRDDTDADDIASETTVLAADRRWNILLLSYTSVVVTAKAESFELVYREQRPFEIKIIGATNAIEAGATLRNLHCVVDSARQLTRVVYPLLGRDVMLSLPISEVARMQRRGRVGRTGPGVYIGLYTEETKKSLLPSPPPSTLVGATLPSSIYNIVSNKTLDAFKETIGNPLVIGKLLGVKQAGCHLPITDIIQQIQLLTPISMDSCIQVMSRLVSLGLVDWDGSLTTLGIQVISFRGMSLGEAFLRSYLLGAIIHPFEVDLLCSTVSEAVSRTEIASEVDWKPIISRFYSKGVFTFKDRPPTREDVMDVIRRVLRCFDAFSAASSSSTASSSSSSSPPSHHSRWTDMQNLIEPHPKWGRFKIGEARAVIYSALESHSGRVETGTFYAPLSSNEDSVASSTPPSTSPSPSHPPPPRSDVSKGSYHRERVLSAFSSALREVTEKMGGKRKSAMQSEDMPLASTPTGR